MFQIFVKDKRGEQVCNHGETFDSLEEARKFADQYNRWSQEGDWGATYFVKQR